MPLDPRRLLDWRIDEVEQGWTARDAAFYALALGLPADPLAAVDLPYVYEGGPQGLRVLPAFATVLADPGFWLRDPRLGLDWPRMLHAAQSLTMHRPLAPCGRVRSSSWVAEVRDGGRERGAWVVTERVLRDAVDGAPVCTLRQTSLLRGDGGFEGEATPAKARSRTTAEPPAALASHDHHVPAQAALLFRLCGDLNPLHADPALAASAGYDKPILHGMATYGVACHGVIAALGIAPGRLASFEARFTAPVFPGETLRTRVWGEGGVHAFDVVALERETVAARGSAVIA